MKLTSAKKVFGSSRLLVVLLVIETAMLLVLLHQDKPAHLSTIAIEPDKNYSLLINNERFPLKANPGQKIIVSVSGDAAADIFPPRRVVVQQNPEQDQMAKVPSTRFQFYYENPAKLEPLYRQENLGRLKGDTQWKTVENVLAWVHRQVNLGVPKADDTQNAVELLKKYRRGEQGWCAQYCYVTVQVFQALGFYSRYLTNNGHEICEVWIPELNKWVCLDPSNQAYFTDAAGQRLSALEIARKEKETKLVSPSYKGSSADIIREYEKLWYWLRSDLASHPINIYDLNRYRCRAILRKEDLKEIGVGDLYTMFPDELYSDPRVTPR